MNGLPPVFAEWFARRGWQPRAHQLALLEKAEAGLSTLLIAPTGAGKTLAGFLPSLIALSAPPSRNLSEPADTAADTSFSREREKVRQGMRGNSDPSGKIAPQPSSGASRHLLPHAGEGRPAPSRPRGIHTLYISPLKALAVDIARNLETPIREMGLSIRVETRTGDTPHSKRDRQKREPPEILLTTPEQVALMLASPDAENFFGELRCVIFDELHALAPSKRGDLLALGFARLRRLAPGLVAVGLSATVRDPDELRRWLTPQPGGLAELVVAAREEATPPLIRILDTAERLPWAGHTARHAVAEIYAAIQAHRMTLIFVNTRMQAELVFQLLWSVNDAGLRIALHHGSLDVSQRRKVEAAMGVGGLDAVVCTSTLDLGIDWGDVDLVVNVGAPKGASRLLQRIGRANHRLDEPSQALLVPSNRFEVLECRAAVDAAYAGAQDAVVERSGALDVLCQHILGMAVAGPFAAEDLYAEVSSAEPYAGLDRQDFDDCLAFAATGGYALKSYDRFAKIRQMADGRWRVSNPGVAQSYRMNIGTIIEATMLKVRLGRARRGMTGFLGGRVIGEVEEYFVETMTPGDTFVFAGEVLRYEAIVEDSVLATRAMGADPKVPSYEGGKFPLSTHLAARVRSMLAEPESWHKLPGQVRDWLEQQRRLSLLPGERELLVETFPRAGRYYLVAYPFEGRLAHQTLGMLLTRRLERARLKPLGFVATDYSIAVWGLSDIGLHAERDPALLGDLFGQDMLGDDLEAWLDESNLMKRTFRACAIIAGLIERRFPGQEKRSKQITMSTDLVYDVLRKHEPGHVLLRAARADAATGLLDIRRLSEMLSRIRGRIIHKELERPSPLSVPVLLEIGRESIHGEARDALLEEATEELVKEAMGDGGLAETVDSSGSG